MQSTLGPPVVPAQSGRFTLGAAVYAIGREHVVECAPTLLARSTHLACDIETAGLDEKAMSVKCVSFATTDRALILDPRDPVQADIVAMMFEATTALTFHNSAFDVPILVRHGWMQPEHIAKVWDTLIWARLANPDDHGGNGLEAAAERFLNVKADDQLTKMFKALGMKKSDGFEKFDLDRAAYISGAASDVLVTAALHDPVKVAAYRRLRDHPFGEVQGLSHTEAVEMVDREQIINRTFLKRSAKGLLVDLEFLDQFRASVVAQQDQDTALLRDNSVKPGLASSIVKFLVDGGLLPDLYPRTPTGKVSTTADNLALLTHPVAQAFVRHKQTSKIEKDYLQKVVDLADDQDRIHPATKILAAATGRMSMGGPPLQQFPEGARGIVLADPGDALTSIDWSQIEPVVAANVAQDMDLLEPYEEGTGDVYTVIMEYAGIDRKTAKKVVLGLLYGEGMKKLGLALGIGESDSMRLKEQVFNAMPRVARLLGNLRRAAQAHKLVFTVSGRILPIPMGRDPLGNWSVATHKGVNYFVQGSAYDVLADVLLRIEDAGLSDAVYLAMHDELVVSTGAAHQIGEIMKTPPERLCRLSRRIPVLRVDQVDLGARWAAA